MSKEIKGFRAYALGKLVDRYGAEAVSGLALGEERSSVVELSNGVAGFLQKILPRLTGIQRRFSVEAAVGLPAIGAAVNRISWGVAELPINVYEVNPADGTEKPVPTTDPEARIIGSRWSKYETAIDGAQRVIASSMLEGKGAAWVERTPGGQLVSITPLPGANVSRRREGIETVYEFSGALAASYGITSDTQRLPRENLVYLPFTPPSDGVSDVSPLEATWPSIRAALASQRFMSWFMERGAAPLTVYGKDSGSTGNYEKEQEAFWKAQAKMQDGHRRTMLIPPGYKPYTTGGNPRDANAFDMMAFGVVEVARIYDIPPIMLHDLSRSTYANYEQARLAEAATIERHARRFGLEFSNILWPEGNRIVKLDTSMLGRESFKTRMEGFRIGIDAGVYTRNEIRVKEGEEESDQDGMDVYNTGPMSSMVTVNQGTTNDGGEGG